MNLAMLKLFRMFLKFSIKKNVTQNNSCTTIQLTWLNVSGFYSVFLTVFFSFYIQFDCHLWGGYYYFYWVAFVEFFFFFDNFSVHQSLSDSASIPATYQAFFFLFFPLFCFCVLEYCTLLSTSTAFNHPSVIVSHSLACRINPGCVLPVCVPVLVWRSLYVISPSQTSQSLSIPAHPWPGGGTAASPSLLLSLLALS